MAGEYRLPTPERWQLRGSRTTVEHLKLCIGEMVDTSGSINPDGFEVAAADSPTLPFKLIPEMAAALGLVGVAANNIGAIRNAMTQPVIQHQLGPSETFVFRQAELDLGIVADALVDGGPTQPQLDILYMAALASEQTSAALAGVPGVYEARDPHGNSTHGFGVPGGAEREDWGDW